MRHLSLMAAILLLLPSVVFGQRQERGSLYGMVVVIDPGHGGSDPALSKKGRGSPRVRFMQFLYLHPL